MRKLLGFALMLGGAGILCGQVIDPLHGYCGGAGQCIDNGNNSPTGNNPPTDFGFTVSPGPATGDLLIDILVPDNEDASPSTLSFGLTGSVAATASLFSTTPWSSGMLDGYLGISASPANPIGAYLPCTQGPVSCGDTGSGDAGATGFYVYVADLGTLTLNGASTPNVFPLENLSSGVPEYSSILGFFNEGTVLSPDWVATANSGAIFVDGPAPAVPEPASVALLGTALIAIGGFMRKKLA